MSISVTIRIRQRLCRMGLLCLIATLTACGGGGSSTPASHTYSTTSNVGDYAEWTISGDQLSANWDVVQTDGTLAYTLVFDATCSAADSYGVRNCTVDPTTSTCTDGTATCPGTVTGSFAMMEAPGVALFTQFSSVLNIGFAKDSSACSADVSGDYTTIRTALGGTENFGIYRSDTDFLNIVHADFGFDVATGSSAPMTDTPSVAYRTGTASETLADGGCNAGVRTRLLGSGDTIRSMITASGLSVLDLPSGQGGLISFRTTRAASLADFANKQFNGISFPDNSGPEAIKASSGSVSGNQVTLSAMSSVSGSMTAYIQALATTGTVTSPAYPDFSVAPSGYTSTATPLALDYAAPADIPGLFKIDGVYTDTGRVILAAMNYNGKLIAVGMVYNYRTTSDIDPSTGAAFSSDGLYNTGNFILFEK